MSEAAEARTSSHGLVRRLGLFDATMLVMGGIIGSKYDAAVVPGRWFEMPGHFRVGLGCGSDILSEGLSRLGQALDDLK